MTFYNDDVFGENLTRIWKNGRSCRASLSFSNVRWRWFFTVIKEGYFRHLNLFRYTIVKTFFSSIFIKHVFRACSQWLRKTCSCNWLSRPKPRVVLLSFVLAHSTRLPSRGVNSLRRKEGGTWSALRLEQSYTSYLNVFSSTQLAQILVAKADQNFLSLVLILVLSPLRFCYIW